VSVGELRPRKQPRQARSAAMVELILSAAARVLASESLAGFNTNRVADIAGISVGSLYQYFPNKSALVAALIERHQEAVCHAVETCVSDHVDTSLETVIDALAELLIQQQYGDPLLAAALDHEERRLPLADVLGASRQRVVEAMETLFAQHRSSLAADLSTSAAQDCFVIAQALVEAEVGERTNPSGDLKGRVTRALLGYLTLER
jgi:AcrR family transcriptional regulator